MKKSPVELPARDTTQRVLLIETFCLVIIINITFGAHAFEVVESPSSVHSEQFSGTLNT